MRGLALKKEKSFYDKQRGEKTIFNTMSLNDGGEGDIGFVYFSNLETAQIKAQDLPTLEERVKFTEFKNLTIIGQKN